MMGSLRAALTVGLAAVLAGTATVAGGGQARANAQPCQEYVTVFQTTSDGSVTGPGTRSDAVGGFDMDLRAPTLRYVAMGGVVRPRRSATFHYKNEAGVEVRTRTTRPSDDGGVIRQDKPENVMLWDVSDGSQRISVFADFHTRCGGDDVQVFNVPVGTITTFPAPPVAVNPKYLVLSVAYSPPGSQSNIDYGSSTTLGARVSISNSFTSNIGVSNTLTFGQDFTIGSSANFSQKAQDTQTVTVEKTTGNDIIIPGPRNSLDGIDHNEDVVFVWLNPKFNIAPDSRTSLLFNGLDVDPRDPVSPNMDVVQLTVRELKDPSLINPGDASRLQRSWSPTGALTAGDFNAILARDPFANGSTAIDPGRFDLLPVGPIDYRPADPGGQPITQRVTLRLQAASTQSQSATFTTTLKFDESGSNFSLDLFNGSLTEEHKLNQTLEFTNTVSLDQTTTANQTTTLNLTGPAVGYQGPTAVQVYQDSLFGTLLFAFAPIPTFEIAAPGPTQTVTQGGSAAFPLTTQRDFGFNGTVSFDPVGGLPAGAQASFSPASVAAGEQATLNVATTAQTPAGTFPLTVTARSGLIIRHLTVNLVVNPLPFTLSATPSSQTVSSGQGTTYTVTVNPAAGFSGPVQLSGPDGLPPGATASYSRTTITGSGSATLTVATSAGTPAGTWPLTIRAAGGGITPSATVNLVVDNTQDFGLTVTPQAAGVFAGDTALYTVTTTAINGFAGAVNLTVGGQPAGTTAAFSVNPITGAGSSTLGIATTTGTAPGNYQITITGAGGGLSHSQTVSLTVSPPRPDFSLAVTPSTRSAPQGGSATYAVSTATIAGFTGSIGLSVTGLPAGATAGFSATPVSPGSGSALTVSVGSNTPAGSYQLAVIGASGSVSHGQVVTLTVTAPAPDFTLAATPGTQSAPPGGGMTYSVATAAVGGFTGSIGLSVTGMPAGVTGVWTATPVSAGSSSTLTVSVGSNATPGSYQITITGASGSLSHSQVVTLGVSTPANDFTLTVTPTALSVTRGSGGSLSIATAGGGSFGDSIDLSVSGLPAGMNASFDNPTVFAGTDANLYYAVGSSTAPGTYTITVTGTSGGLVHSQQVTLTVT